MIGKCLCGGVTFRISGAVPNLYQCHCSQCRKQGGSSANAATVVEESRFSWESGRQLVKQYKDRSGFNSHFCSICGCPVPNLLGAGDLVWVPAGLLEDSEGLEIVAHLHVASKASWDNIPHTGEQFDTMPDLDALNKLLRPKVD